MLTGEPMPVGKAPGAKMVAGSLNTTGSFTMRAEKVGRDTMLAKIVQMVAQAQRSRAPIQRLADRVSGWFVPLVIAVALAAFSAWAWFGPEPPYAYGLMAAVSVLIIACPCALGLATPMSIMVGVGRGARAGILIKNAEALERMERVDTLVIDKTGTLTEGKPRVIAVTPTHGLDEQDILRFAAAVESRSEHPIAHAIVAAAAERGIELPDVRGFNSPTGKGVVGMIERHRVALGSAKFLAELSVAAAELEPMAERLRQDGATAVFLAVDGKASGVIAVADPVRDTAPAALTALKRAGIRIVMLTGDSRTTANTVASNSASTRSRPTCCPSRNRRSWSGCAAKGAWSPWRATASTTRRVSPPPTSALRWGRAPMSRSKAPGSRCSSPTSTASSRRGACPRQ